MEIFNTIITLIIALTVLVSPIFIIISILKFIDLKKINNVDEKKINKKRAWKILLFPVFFIILMVVLWGLAGIVYEVIKG